jgi:hypothetical protein
MIYVFNSGFRNVHRSNVLNTLFLPDGYTNQYRYSAWGDKRNATPEVAQKLLAMKAGDPLAVVFIDRYAQGGYVYHPLRLGKFIKATRGDDKLFVRAQLQSFIRPHEARTFSDRFSRQLAEHGIPKLTRNDPKVENDGNYVVIGPSVFEDTTQYAVGEDAWKGIVEYLVTTTALSTTDSEKIIFARAQVHSTKGKPMSPVIGPDGSARFKLTRGTEYRLEYTYRFPDQQQNQQSEATVSFKTSDGLKAFKNTDFTIGGLYDRTELPIAPNRFAEDGAASLAFEYALAGGSAASLVTPNADLQFSISDSARFWVYAVLLVLAFGFGGAFMNYDFARADPPGITWGNTWNAISGSRAIGALVQAAALLGLGRLVGKKML